MKLKSIRNAKDLKSKRVLLRVNFDCPVKNGRVTDMTRIQAALPTIRYLAAEKARLILISHLGRPLEHKNIKTQEHKSKGIRDKYTLKPVFENLKSKILNPRLRGQVKFIDDCLGKRVEREVEQMKPGEIILLENLRFYPGEEKNDSEFARRLASLADIYVNDAFSVCHRQHASVSAIAKYLPSYAGFDLEKEIGSLSGFLQKSKHPFIAIMGGAKISTKIGVIRNLAKVADFILLGGALFNSFLKAKGINIGKSIYEPGMIGEAKKLLKNKKLILPVDVRVKFSPPIGGRDLKIKDLKTIDNQQFEILDIGPGTVGLFSQYLKDAKMVVWNGPMGYFEDKKFAWGTRSVFRSILSNKKARVIIGGGETVAAIKKFKVSGLGSKVRNKNKVFISTGGGAMLEFLEGKILPGIKSLIMGNE